MWNSAVTPRSAFDHVASSEAVALEECQGAFRQDFPENASLCSHSVLSYRVFCLLGDGEMSEGSVWEAMSFASYYQLDNLVAIMDINRLGQTDSVPLQHYVEKYQKRCEAFGYASKERKKEREKCSFWKIKNC